MTRDDEPDEGPADGRGVDLLRADAPRPRRRRSVPRAHPAIPIVLGVIWLLIAYTAILVVDVAGLGQERLAEAVPDRPVMWLLLFEPSSPTELLVWATLGVLALVSANISGRLRLRGEERPAAFWRLIGVGAVLMLMEDAGDVRYIFHQWVEIAGILADHPHQLPIVEAIWYAVIASVFAVAILRHGRAVLGSRATVVLGTVGVVAYAVASLGSLSREVFPWYVDLGARLEALIPGELPRPPGWHDINVHWFLTDRVFEESFELLGAVFLLAAALAYRRTVASAT